MPRIDDFLHYSNEQAITSSAASTKYVNHSSNARHFNSVDLYIEMIVKETFVSGGSSTLDVALQMDTSSTFTPDFTKELFNAIPKADLVAGAIFKAKIPLISDKFQYSRIYYTVNTANFTAGKITLRFTTAVKI
jgi:hypothetical protein